MKSKRTKALEIPKGVKEAVDKEQEAYHNLKLEKEKLLMLLNL